MVGLTEQEAQSKGVAYAVGRARFDQNTRAAISGSTERDGEVRLRS